MAHSKEWDDRIVSQQLLDIVLSTSIFTINLNYPDVDWDHLSSSSIRQMQQWITSDREVPFSDTYNCLGGICSNH